MTPSRRTILAGASGLALGATALAACASVPASATFPTIGRIDKLDGALDALIAPDAVIEQLADGFSWSEGPVWVPADGGYLLFSDVPQNRIHRWSERDGISSFMAPSGWAGAPDPALREGGSNGLIPGPAGTILMADSGSRGLARLDLATKAKTFLTERHDGRRYNSPNDLVQARSGAIFFTDPPYGLADDDRSPAKEQPVNGLYRLDVDGRTTLLDGTLTRPNGVGLSPDQRTLYVAVSDPATSIVVAYALDAAGNVGPRRTLSDMTSQVSQANPGLPDGMAVDRHGNLFVTGPGGVHVVTPEGRTLGVIRTGGPVANCTFDDDGVLYMTSGAVLARVRTRTGF